MAGCPVQCDGPGAKPGTIRVRCNGVSFADVRPADLEPARLWVARGKDWRGPFKRWRDLVEPLEEWDSEYAAFILRSFATHGRGNPLGSYQICGGWRFILAWGGDDAPRRYNG